MSKKITQKQIDTSLEALKADIAAAVESATTMKARVQHALVGCVSHWSITGSNAGLADMVNLFITELGQGINGKAVVAWCEKHLHMEINNAGDALYFKPVKASDLDTKAASAQLWHSMKPQNPFKGFDLNAEIAKLVAKAEKADKEQDEKKASLIKVDPKALAALKALAPAE